MNKFSRRDIMLKVPAVGLASIAAASLASRGVSAQPTGVGVDL